MFYSLTMLWIAILHSLFGCVFNVLRSLVLSVCLCSSCMLMATNMMMAYASIFKLDDIFLHPVPLISQHSALFFVCNGVYYYKLPGIQNLMIEVVKKPSLTRKSAISSLLWYAMRGTSLRFHSRADQVLRLLLDNSLYSIDTHFNGGELFYTLYSTNIVSQHTLHSLLSALGVCFRENVI